MCPAELEGLSPLAVTPFIKQQWCWRICHLEELRYFHFTFRQIYLPKVLLEKSTEVSGVVLAYALWKQYLVRDNIEQIVASLSLTVLSVELEKTSEVDCIQLSICHVGNATVKIMLYLSVYIAPKKKQRQIRLKISPLQRADFSHSNLIPSETIRWRHNHKQLQRYLCSAHDNSSLGAGSWLQKRLLQQLMGGLPKDSAG